MSLFRSAPQFPAPVTNNMATLCSWLKTNKQNLLVSTCYDCSDPQEINLSSFTCVAQESWMHFIDLLRWNAVRAIWLSGEYNNNKKIHSITVRLTVNWNRRINRSTSTRCIYIFPSSFTTKFFFRCIKLCFRKTHCILLTFRCCICYFGVWFNDHRIPETNRH